MQNFNNYPQFSSSIIEQHHDLYEELNNVVRDFPKILRPFQSLFEDKKLKTYSPVNYFLLKRFEKYIQIWDVTNHPQDHDMDPDDQEDYLYDVWTESDFCEEFLDINSKNLNPIESSKKMLDLEEARLLDIYATHFLMGNKISRPNLIELGEAPNCSPIVKAKTSQIELENKGARKNLHLYNFDKEDHPIQKERITLALARIKKYSPAAFDRFFNLTTFIAPLNDEGLVSYSMQDLPEVSCINLFNRDDLDLMDDLLHENGHHHMNFYLRSNELIIEDDDDIYFSPWRRALRPIRGIYHAVFTFYFACELYADLAKNLNDFSKEEQCKIINRFMQEFYMLGYCKRYIEHALKTQKITKLGFQLMQEIFKLTNSFSELAEDVDRQYKSDLADFYEVKKYLEEQKQTYTI
jgi:hypothetical protein